MDFLNDFHTPTLDLHIYTQTICYIHLDRGSQYTSKLYLISLLTNGIALSFCSKGYPYHNAWIESFHAQIKKEYIYRRH